VKRCEEIEKKKRHLFGFEVIQRGAFQHHPALLPRLDGTALHKRSEREREKKNGYKRRKKMIFLFSSFVFASALSLATGRAIRGCASLTCFVSQPACVGGSKEATDVMCSFKWE